MAQISSLGVIKIEVCKQLLDGRCECETWIPGSENRETRIVECPGRKG